MHFNGNLLDIRPVMRTDAIQNILLGSLDVDLQEVDPVYVVLFYHVGECAHTHPLPLGDKSLAHQRVDTLAEICIEDVSAQGFLGHSSGLAACVLPDHILIRWRVSMEAGLYRRPGVVRELGDARLGTE